MRISKTQRKLERKRDNLIKALTEQGNQPHHSLTGDHVDLLRFGYGMCGKLFPPCETEFSYPALHAHYDALRRWLRRPKKKKAARSHNFNAFYRSYDWRKLRYQVLGKWGAACMVCGRDRKDGTIIHVDHIKPLRFNWDLRLDPENLQVLCEECNHGKGNWDSTDWREPRLSQLMGESCG